MARCGARSGFEGGGHMEIRLIGFDHDRHGSAYLTFVVLAMVTKALAPHPVRRVRVHTRTANAAFPYMY